MFFNKLNLPKDGMSRYVSHLSILILFFFSSNMNLLVGQNQSFDPDNLIGTKLESEKKTYKEEVIVLTAAEKTYISQNLKAIRKRKKVVKRALKKAEALNQIDQALELKKELEDLSVLTTKYYDVLYKAHNEN